MSVLLCALGPGESFLSPRLFKYLLFGTAAEVYCFHVIMCTDILYVHLISRCGRGTPFFAPEKVCHVRVMTPSQSIETATHAFHRFIVLKLSTTNLGLLDIL